MSETHSTFLSPINHKYNPEFALPGSKPHYNPDKIGQLQHIFLDIKVDLEKQTCQGWAVTTIKPYQNKISSITLDAVNMRIDAVKINDQILPFDYDGKEIFIQLDANKDYSSQENLEIAVEYFVEKPQEGINFVKPSKYYPQKPLEMWTQGESEGSRHWFPCFDFPAKTSSTEIRVSTDSRFTAVSNGELIEEREFETNGKNYKTWHFLQKKPHPNYLMFLGIGEYAVVEDKYESEDGRTVPLRYLGPKGSEDLLKLNGQKTPEMIKFLEEKYGVNYPWAKYDQLWATDFIWGGMENTSCTVITADRGLGEKKSLIDIDFPEMVVEHELAHQWFGDLVVVKHWSNLWIKEGAATYSETMWKEHAYGKEEADYYRLNEIRDYLGYASEYQRPVSTNFYRHTTDLYDGFSYSKAGLVYHMIRAELGEELFWKSLQRFLQDNAHQPVEPVDFLRAIEKTTGRNLQSLLDQYIFSNGHPDFEVSYSWDSQNNLVKLTVKQKQSKKDDPESLFDLKIPVAFAFLNEQKSSLDNSNNQDDSEKKNKEATVLQDENLENNSLKNNIFEDLQSDSSDNSKNNYEFETIFVKVNQAEQAFYFPMSKKPDFILFDHQNNYLKTIKLDFPLPELEKQLNYAPDVLAKVFAAQAIAKKGNLHALNILKDAYKKESFWGVRLEIIRCISEIKLDQSFANILLGLEDENVKVKRMALASLSKFKTLASWLQVKKITEQDEKSYLVEMQACATLGSIAGSELLSDEIKQETFEILAKKLETANSWADLVRQGAIRGLSCLNSLSEVVDLLLENTKPGKPIDVRRAAITAVAEMSVYQNDFVVAKIINALEECINETNLTIQMSLVSGLEQMNTSLAIKLLSILKTQAVDTRVMRDAEVAILTVQKNLSSQKSFLDIRKELEELKKQNQELKSQMQEVIESNKAKEKKDSKESVENKDEKSKGKNKH